MEEPKLDIRGIQKARPTLVDRGLDIKPARNMFEEFMFARLGKTEGEASKFAQYGKTEGREDTANVNNKQLIKQAYGGTLALAIAMMEDKYLDANPHKEYPFGDAYPQDDKDRSRAGKNKECDAANFGIYKMNWYMISKCPTGIALRNSSANLPRFPSAPLLDKTCKPQDWEIEKKVGKQINDSPKLATQILIEAMRKWSMDAPYPPITHKGNFWAGHRWGQKGIDFYMMLNQKDKQDILNYYDAVMFIKNKCDNDPNVWTTKTRYWKFIPAI